MAKEKNPEVEINTPSSADVTFANPNESHIKKKRVSLSTKAGLSFAPARVLRQLRKGNFAKHIQKGMISYSLI